MGEDAPRLNEVQSRSATTLYATLYMMMVPVARECGYALALHGSMARDLDVVAIPWTEEALPVQALLDRFMEKFSFYEMNGGGLTRKPNGRMSFCMGWDGGLYVDLSVMPQGSVQEKEALLEMAEERRKQDAFSAKCGECKEHIHHWTEGYQCYYCRLWYCTHNACAAEHFKTHKREGGS